MHFLVIFKCFCDAHTHQIQMDSIPGSSLIPPTRQSKENNVTVQPQLSKTQRKKKARMERLLAVRKEKRKQEMLRKKAKRLAMKEAGNNIQPEKPMIHSMNESNCRLRVVVDMAFDELMDARTVKKAVSQLAYCYSVNRRAPNPLQYFIVNVQDKTKEIFESCPTYSNWDVHIMAQPLINLWTTEEIIYLTADSENLLETLDEEKVYVIGGLLDHNHHKGICLKKAKENGFGHARLPIDSYFRISGRKVLTINQVFQILVNYSQESNWEKAFLDVIPKRKGIEPIAENSIEEDLRGNDADEQSPTVGATSNESIELLANDDTDANTKTNE